MRLTPWCHYVSRAADEVQLRGREDKLFKRTMKKRTYPKVELIKCSTDQSVPDFIWHQSTAAQMPEKKRLNKWERKSTLRGKWSGRESEVKVYTDLRPVVWNEEE